MPVNRINPGIPPSRRPGARVKPEPNPLDRVARESHALREMLKQQGYAGEASESAAVYDLEAIYRAAEADPGCPPPDPGETRKLPVDFVTEDEDSIVSLDLSHPGKVLVDRKAAFSYVQDVDDRVMEAAVEQMQAIQKAKIADDPIRAGVDACRGGPYGLMVVALEVMARTETTPEAYLEAVRDRARLMASEMEDRAGETLLSTVLEAIAGCPDLNEILIKGESPDTLNL